MPNVIESKLMCFTCRKHHLNITPSGQENLRRLGCTEQEIAHMAVAGDLAALAAQPGRHRIIGPADYPRLLSLGCTEAEILAMQAESIERATRGIDAEIPPQNPAEVLAYSAAVSGYDTTPESMPEAIPDAVVELIQELMPNAEVETAFAEFDAAIAKVRNSRVENPELRKQRRREQNREAKRRQREKEGK